MHNNEYEKGFNNCKEELLKIIYKLADQICKWYYPPGYEYSEDMIRGVMILAGLDLKYLPSEQIHDIMIPGEEGEYNNGAM